MRATLLTITLAAALVVFIALVPQARAQDDAKPVCPGCGEYNYPGLTTIFGLRMGAHISNYTEVAAQEVDAYKLTPPEPNLFLDDYVVWVQPETRRVIGVTATGTHFGPVENEARYEYIKFLLIHDFMHGEEASSFADEDRKLREYVIARDDGEIVLEAWDDRVSLHFSRAPETLPEPK